MNMVWPGKVVMVFDSKLWTENGGDSKTDSFFRKATILSCYSDRPHIDFVDVKFHHDGRISKGHFQSGIQDVVEDDGSEPQSKGYVDQDQEDPTRSLYHNDNEDSEGYREDGCPWIFTE